MARLFVLLGLGLVGATLVSYALAVVVAAWVLFFRLVNG